MATVRITNQHRYEIRNKIHSVFQAKIAKVDSSIAAIDVIDPIYNAVVSDEEKQAIEVLGSRWLQTQEFSLVQIKDEHGVIHAWTVKHKKTVLPIGFTGGRPPNELLPGMQGYDEVYELVNWKAHLIKERSDLLNTIDTLLKNATTINKIQELWPSVIEYLDQDTIRQLNTPHVKQTRTKRPELKLDDAAKASLVKLNLTKAH